MRCFYIEYSKTKNIYRVDIQLFQYENPCLFIKKSIFPLTLGIVTSCFPMS